MAALSELGLMELSSDAGPRVLYFPAGFRAEEEGEELEVREELASGLPGSAFLSSPFFKLLWLWNGLWGRTQDTNHVQYNPIACNYFYDFLS